MLLVTLGLLAAFEFFAWIVPFLMKVSRRKRKGQKVFANGTWGSSNNSDAKVATSTTIKNVSDYEKVTLLSKHGKSVFSRNWAKPIPTIFGAFFHASTMIEDNLVLFGPLLISLDLYILASLLSLIIGKKQTILFIIGSKLYVGVLVGEFCLMPRKENRRIIPDFVENYDFESMSHFINGQPVQ